MIWLQDQKGFGGNNVSHIIKVPLVSKTLADSGLLRTFWAPGYHTGLPFGKNIWNIYVTEPVPQDEGHIVISG